MVLLKKKDNNILITSRDHVIFYDLKSQEDKLLKIPEPVLPENLTKGQIDVLKKEIRNITSFDFYNASGYTVISTENKQVVLYDKHFNIVKNFIVNRAASKICFTLSNDVLVADKTGDVYLYKMDSDKEEPQLLLGHLSVILDMTLSECGKYIITCDRDEKIRVSYFPNAYNIVSFCLGHTEFVTSIKLVKDILVSASGDGTIRFWNYLAGEQLGIINANNYISERSLLEVFAKEMDKEKVDVVALPIIDMQLYLDANKLYIAVSIHNYSGIQLYSTDLSTFKSNYLMTVDINSNSFCFCLSDDELYILSDKLSIYKLNNDMFVEDNSVCLDKLYEKYKEVLKPSVDDYITVLYKRKFDNVQEYLERKRQRLEGK